MRRGRFPSFALLGLLTGGIASCGGTREVEVVRPVAAGLRAFLVSPFSGWTEPVSEPWRGELERAHAALVDAGDVEVARAAADALVARLGDALPPAQLLRAQVDFASAMPQEVRIRLEPLVEAYPQYDAALLLLGRAAELTGDPWIAFVSYRAVGASAIAADRLAAVRPAALQHAREQLDQGLGRGRLDEAERWLALLLDAAPEEALALDATRAVAAARGDAAGELEALRRLAAFAPPDAPLDRALVERRAELELANGQAGVAADLYAELARRHPGDQTLLEGLAAAQFRYRLELLPDEVEQLTQAPALTRGDFATLLYWLVPGARGGRTESATIVTDVPEEHPQRVAVVRVVNLGLLPLDDPTLRRFSPDAPITRGRALGALLQAASVAPRPASCLAPLADSPRPSRDLLCTVAAGCGWIVEPAECLPEAPLDGPTAERFLRLALGMLGG